MPRIIHMGTCRPKNYLSSALGEDLVLHEDQPELDTCTSITVSPDSTLVQAVSECMSIWEIHTHEDLPLWIGYNAEALLLATVLNTEYGGGIELREVVA